MEIEGDSVTDVIDYPVLDDQTIERYLSLDSLVNQYDAEGQGPLKRGEDPFRWSFVETEARALLGLTPDLRVAVWLLRALIVQKGLVGLEEGLGTISKLLKMPAAVIFPRSEDGEHVRDAHVVPLGWLGGQAFLGALSITKAHPEANLRLSDALVSSSAADVLSGVQREEAARWLRASRAALIEIRESIISDGGSWERDPIIATEFISSVLPLLATGTKVPHGQDQNSVARDQAMVVETTIGNEPLIRVESRADVKKVVVLLLEYYKKNEPAHPASILLDRLQRTIDASFEEILGELFADASSLVDRIRNPAR